MNWVMRKRETGEIMVKIREIVGWGGAGIKGQQTNFWAEFYPTRNLSINGCCIGMNTR
jgi:hypothetical protein